MSACQTQACPNQAYESKTARFRYCNPCRTQREKDRDLAGWAYRKLKSNARGRGVPFTLTLPEFREFCYETKILHGRGRTSQSFHVDRIVDEKGYAAGNLQKLTNAENLAKEQQRRKLIAYVPATTQYEKGGIRMIDVTPGPAAICPF